MAAGIRTPTKTSTYFLSSGRDHCYNSLWHVLSAVSYNLCHIQVLGAYLERRILGL